MATTQKNTTQKTTTRKKRTTTTTTTSHQKCIIVIARFQEKLEWIKTAPYNKFNLIIYNKGNNDDFTKTDKILEIINLPNIGRESHTYIYHIINTHKKYNPEITVFFPGSLESKFKRNDSLIILRLLESTAYKKSVFVGQIHDDTQLEEQLNLSETKYSSSHQLNKKHIPTSTVFPAKYRPYKKWLKNMKLKITNFITFYGTFSLHRNVINKYNSAYYTTLINQLQPPKLTPKSLVNYSNPETGFFFERSWATIFYSPKNILYDWKLEQQVSPPNVFFKSADKFTTI